jgi:hypothetical protein
MTRRRRQAAVAVIATLLLIGTPVADSSAEGGPLWGKHFVAIRVRGAEGKQAPIARPADVHVSFSRGHGRWINWEANCNGYGAKVRIAGGRFRLTQIISTVAG